VLAEAGIDYMITGSVASSMQGEPRSTHDIDVVVALTESAATRVLQAFPPPAFYLAEEAVRDAIRRRSMFNLLSLDEGEKVDFWLLTEQPFDQSRFARKRVANVLGMQLNVSAPEDTILAKLHWAKLSGGSEKQFTDALRVYEVQQRTLDMDYLDRWAVELGVEELWQRVRAESAPL
jgi:hypothetical protein